ncbi:CAP domain-containing protein [Chamaesiphon polymorphus CCALA 037]|uniref:CAP domain-containing protein n=2 Tax=Chamaesiphon TaxID=217161 RepID=A0A2T1GDX1_9CYAN|nr:CAP domain-containing protein [Chamaesiphon polymorphus CCALA 037]
MNSIELATYNLVNKYRQSRNLPPLVADPDISAQAKAHSEQMARSGNMSHDGFNERVASVAKTIVYRNAAENVAYNMGYGQPDLVAVQGWIESPGHKKNMTGQFDLTGIGVARGAKGEYYFTQIFIRKAFYVKDAD